jgi:molybdopterin-guanine dinucleotide biosynthesis protein A
MMRATPELSAFVLAGGKSSRMGTNKALLELNGQTLLQRTLNLAKTLTSDVRIVGQHELFGQLAPVVEDVYKNRGPLGGIHAALTVTSSDLNLILAVDLPFLQQKFLQYLVSEAQASGAMVTVPQAAGGYQPLCAIYRRDFGRFAEAALANGKNKIDALFSGNSIRVINEDELQRIGFPLRIFDNLNSREDWERASQEIAAT